MMQELAEIVETGTGKDGVVHWQRIDPVRVIKECFGIKCSGCSAYLAKPSFSHISGHPQQNERVHSKKLPLHVRNPHNPFAHKQAHGSRTKRVLDKKTGTGQRRERALPQTNAMIMPICLELYMLQAEFCPGLPLSIVHTQAILPQLEPENGHTHEGSIAFDDPVQHRNGGFTS
ncbi:MAG: hypothetical protein HRT36_02740 [Alphaproteobacteria bacterium]|nr:hypothetical protein [Alphaproteobacteria bacterium]